MYSIKKKIYYTSLNYIGRLDLFFLKLFRSANNNLSVSICTTVMDRLEHLKMTFLQNLLDNGNCKNYEFVLLNYNCPDTRTHDWVRENLTSYINNGKVNYYYYNKAKYYSQSHSRNLAFRLAKGDIVCNVDADNFTGQNFISYVQNKINHHNTFLRGYHDSRGTCGRICVKKRDWTSVGGYDENFVGWGREDSDFQSRLKMLNIKPKVILPQIFYNFVQHSDDIRIQNFPMNKKESWEINNSLALSNIKNRTINPNGHNYGHGKVQVNFGKWIEV